MAVQFGVNGHPVWSHGNFTLSQQLDLVKQAGLSSYRVDVGSTADASVLSSLFTLGAQKGVEILPVVVLHPEDYATESAAYTAGKNLLQSLAAQFPGKTWELGNEYDNEAIKGSSYSGASATDYDDAKYAIVRGLIDGMYDGAKLGDSTAKTVVGDAGWYHHGFLDRLAADGVTWDITATHWYSNMGSITAIGGGTTNALKEHADFGKPLWVTEFNGRPDQMTEAQMGTWSTGFIDQLNSNATQYNIQKAHIYEILDQPEFGTSPEARYGLFNTDGTFTPTGTAVDAKMDALNPPGETPTFTTANYTGDGNANTIIGNSLANVIDGAGGNDTIKGGLGNDKIIGNYGTDTMTGGAGADLFDFNLLGQFGPQNAWDTITDFTPSGTTGDRIDLYDLIPGSAAFTYVGSGPHSGAASVRSFANGSNTLVEGDLNGDQAPDFGILITGQPAITFQSFVL